MKKSILIIGLLMVQVIAFAQKNNFDRDLLIGKTWQIKGDEMKGLGTHTSLPDNTTLQFFNDATWKASNPIEGLIEGTWILEADGVLLLMSTNKEESKKLVIEELTKDKLKYKIKNKTATYTHVWGSVN